MFAFLVFFIITYHRYIKPRLLYTQYSLITEYTTGAVPQIEQSDGRIKPRLTVPEAELLFSIEGWFMSDSRYRLTTRRAVSLYRAASSVCGFLNQVERSQNNTVA